MRLFCESLAPWGGQPFDEEVDVLLRCSADEERVL